MNEGREEGNFSRWGELSVKKRRHFAEEAVELIEAGEMPLPSYTWMHPAAELNDEEKNLLVGFFKGVMAEG